MTNALKEKFEKGEPALGFALMYPSPSSMECTAAGWDWVWVDAQHGQMDYATILYTIQIAELLGLSTIVRPSGNELNMFGPILDACATGLMVPMVNSVEQAREVVKAFYFPPLGERSYGGRRVLDVHGREYYQEANDNVKYLNTLHDWFEQLNTVDEFPNLMALFKPIMHVCFLCAYGHSTLVFSFVLSRSCGR